MTKPLPFTAAGIERAIRGIEQAKRFVVGVRVSDGVLLVSSEPLDPVSLVPKIEQTVPASEWEDKQ